MKTTFEVGDEVKVTPKADDIFTYEFFGIIADIRDGGNEGTLFTVEDHDSDFFDVTADQLELREEY